MAESVKLNGMISEEEKNINNAFHQMGKAYYEVFGDNPDPIFINVVAGINDSRKRIASYLDQSKRLKGIVECPNVAEKFHMTQRFVIIVDHQRLPSLRL